jgi:predicted nucleic acid-binding protein
LGLLLDSSIVIDAERRGKTVALLLGDVVSATGNQKVVISSVGFTELVHAVYRSANPILRTRHQQFLQELIAVTQVVSYTQSTALLAGRIDAQQRLMGVTIPSMDLLIGATALELGYSVVTANVRHFQLIPGLKIITL